LKFSIYEVNINDTLTVGFRITKMTQYFSITFYEKSNWGGYRNIVIYVMFISEKTLGTSIASEVQKQHHVYVCIIYYLFIIVSIFDIL